MRLVYITAKKYPSRKTDPFYVQSMAGAFASILKSDFTFLVRGKVPPELLGHNARGVPAPKRLRTLFYFFYLPFYIVWQGWGRETTFLSYDPNLLVVLIFWRPFFKYRVAADWHQLFGDWRDRYIAHGSDRCTTTSLRLKQLLVARTGIAESKVKVAYGGVDPRPFAVTPNRAALELPEDFLVGYVGTFSSIGNPKGLDTMLEALMQLPPHIKMVFVGGTPREIEEYSVAARKLGVMERCLFFKKQPFSRMVEYERAMDVLVIPYPDLPHFRDYGFPMKVWEYLAAGRPVVYSNLSIIAEVLKGHGTPFAPGNPKSLALAVDTIYRGQEEAAREADKNPAALAPYTWEARARAILDTLST